MTEIAIGQIRGLVKPTDAEREAAFELFIELASRTTTAALTADAGVIRETLSSMHEYFGITREVLRKHGCEVAAGRGDGNLTLAAISLRVLNEVIRPRTTTWHPLLLSWEEKRRTDGNAVTSVEWERAWSHADACRADLNALRAQIRTYMDSLAQIAGTPSLTDLVVPVPPSTPISPVVLDRPCEVPAGASPRTSMVQWFHPVEGFRTMRAKRSGDPRRVGRAPAGDNSFFPIELPTGADGTLWFDYVSDLGDAIDPTLAVAWQLTRPEISLPVDRADELPAPPPMLPRGRLLVMGGDEVYPYATRDKYQQQLDLPYRLAAGVQTNGEPPTPQTAAMVAIPGNHDWYGGISLFDDLVVSADTFAGHWRAPQTERWWVVKLSHGWWMWGIDTALDNTIDEAQRAYFVEAAAQLSAGDRVILCTAVPLWQLRQKREEDYFRIRQLLTRLVLARGARVPLFLSGDSHFFAHYRRVDGVADEDHITAGGGGAFLQPTHNLPEQVPYERGSPDFTLTHRWPRPVDSRALATGFGGLRERQFWWLFAIIAAVHAGFAGLVTIRSGVLFSSVDPSTGAAAAARWVIGAWPGWPLLIALVAAMVVATAPNSGESELQSGAQRYGLIHGLAQSGLFVVVAAFGRWVGPQTAWWHFLLVPLAGGVLSTALFVGMVRWINTHIKANDTLAFSSAHLTRYKHFVRMCIDDRGDLSVFVVGLDPVGAGWFEALTTAEATIPPYDSAGTPKMHYVWGKKFGSGNL